MRHRRQRATRAAVAACATLVAGDSAVVVLAEDRVVSWPPVPSEPVKAGGQLRRVQAEGQRPRLAGADAAGLAGSPAMPETPISRSFNS